MFESRLTPLLPWRDFRHRMLKAAGVGLALIAVSLGIGMLGYRYIAGQAWPDAFLNAAMILSGMGPVGELTTTAAKIFAGIYALYSGLTLISIVSVVIAPLIHRGLHKFHLEEAKEPKGE